jgi:aldehyde:ferredoxin oxidoreductase
MAKREGFGEVLADGSARAIEQIGKDSDQYAIQVHGQEAAMHDGKFFPGLAMFYKIDATPGRHTAGAPWALSMGREWAEELVGGPFPEDFLHNYAGNGELYKRTCSMWQVINSSGLCCFAWVSVSPQIIPDFLSAVTGWDFSMDECAEVGERITNLRHAFNVRDGLNPLEWGLPGRIYGDPQHEEGPLAGITVDVDTLIEDFFTAMEWDLETSRPSLSRLRELGMDDVADAL